ncbi:YraN family protein [Oceanicella actignis]|uniref:UPF0102 protein SAMN05216200_10398 n=2 Tax=Oceanicella actignis TaxID=1189325 RepID=A0A1M7SQJ5_9RHOB|nr:putative endonuclease [Oceanicella actignis]SHN60719.1 putative endonuclease [Oceanicella actignis]
MSCPAAARNAPDFSSMRQRRRAAGKTAGRLGRAAEDAALRRYCRAGARPRARNWRAPRAFGGGELDLVIDEGGVVVFVEVKARRTHDDALSCLTAAQRRRILAAAEAYLWTEGAAGREVRFDLALYDGAGRLEVMKNVALD